MQCRVGREHRSNLEADRPAIQVGKDTAGFFDDDRQRSDIEDIHVRFDDRLDLARRQQVIMIEVAIATYAIGSRNDIAQLAPPFAQRQ